MGYAGAVHLESNHRACGSLHARQTPEGLATTKAAVLFLAHLQRLSASLRSPGHRTPSFTLAWLFRSSRFSISPVGFLGENESEKTKTFDDHSRSYWSLIKSYDRISTMPAWPPGPTAINARPMERLWQTSHCWPQSKSSKGFHWLDTLGTSRDAEAPTLRLFHCKNLIAQRHWSQQTGVRPHDHRNQRENVS